MDRGTMMMFVRIFFILKSAADFWMQLTMKCTCWHYTAHRFNLSPSFSFQWEIFIQLRHNFLAHGARHLRDVDIKQQKYQKTCIVECIPHSHRTDVALFNEFNSLFPGQIEHAEMIVETSKLEELVDKRKRLIYVTKMQNRFIDTIVGRAEIRRSRTSQRYVVLFTRSTLVVSQNLSLNFVVIRSETVSSVERSKMRALITKRRCLNWIEW